MTRIVAAIALALWSLSGTAQQPTPQLTPQDRTTFSLTASVALGGNDRWVAQRTTIAPTHPDLC